MAWHRFHPKNLLYKSCPFMNRLQQLCLTTLACSGAALFQPSAHAEGWTVNSIVQRVLATHPELVFYQAEIAAAEGGLKTAGTIANPQLQTTVGTWRTRDVSTGVLTDGPAWSATLNQTFEWPGRVALRKAIAGKEIELAELGLQQMRLALAGEARAASWRLMAANERVRVADEVASRFKALSEVLLQRDPAGAAPRLEARIIEGTSMTMGAEATAARRELADARFMLNQLIGEKPDHPTEVRVERLELAPPASLEKLLGLARQFNFGLRSRVAEVEQQGYEVQLAYNERWPSITVSPYLQKQTASSRETQFGIGVSIPLPLWNHNKGNIQAAEARQVQAEVLLQSQLRKLEREVASHSSAYRIYVEELAKWPPDTLASFRESAKEADDHYRLGALTVNTYTELQKQYVDSVNAVLDSQVGALRAKMELEQLTGQTLDGKSITVRPLAQD